MILLLLFQKKTDVFLPEEFDHINVWATVNRMILNLIKTKKIVFHRPGPKKLHMFPSVESIELCLLYTSDAADE